MKVKAAWLRSTLGLCPWNSPGQNTGVGSLSLLHGIFPTQGLNTGIPHCRLILYQLSHKENPRTLEWVGYSFFSRFSDPRVEPGSPALQADSLPTELSRRPRHLIVVCIWYAFFTSIAIIKKKKLYWSMTV